MLGKLSCGANSEIGRLLKKLQADEDNFDAELRSLDREKYVFPVQLNSLNGETKVDAFSRDLSSSGLGLITRQRFDAGTRMEIQLQLPDAAHTCRARCCWSSKFGESFWSSGWEVEAGDQLDMDSIKNADARFVYDARSTEREKFSVPVIVQQKGMQPQVHGFTMNMSGGGASLIVGQKIREKTWCMLGFIRGDSPSCSVVAECIWSREYGNSNWMVGWKFPRLDRIAKFHTACFDCE